MGVKEFTTIVGSPNSRHRHSRSQDHSSLIVKQELFIEGSNDKSIVSEKHTPRTLANGQSGSGSLTSITQKPHHENIDYLEVRSYTYSPNNINFSSSTRDVNSMSCSSPLQNLGTINPTISSSSHGSLKLSSGSKRNYSDGKQYSPFWQRNKLKSNPTTSMQSVERDISVLQVLNQCSMERKKDFCAYLRVEFIEENYFALDAIGDLLQQHRLGVMTVEIARSKVYEVYFGPNSLWTVEIPLELALELDETLNFDTADSGINGFGVGRHLVKLMDVINIMQRVYNSLERVVKRSFISYIGDTNLAAFYNDLVSEQTSMSAKSHGTKYSADSQKSPFQRRSKVSGNSIV
eukprot:CFRG5137T1